MFTWESTLTGCPVLYLVTLDGKPPGGCKWGSSVIDLCLWKISAWLPCWVILLLLLWLPAAGAPWLAHGINYTVVSKSPSLLPTILTWAPYLSLSLGSQPKCGSWETHPSPPTKAPVGALSLWSWSPSLSLAEHLGNMLQLPFLCLPGTLWGYKLCLFPWWFFCI